jgi:pyruvate,water dikinase
MQTIIWFKDCSYKNKSAVGGKCCSLGELYHLSKRIMFSVADGFAVTTHAYDQYIQYNRLAQRIQTELAAASTSSKNNNLKELDVHSLKIREMILEGSFPEDQEIAIIESYRKLCGIYARNDFDLEVAVRSSAVAEDMPNASFAGQQDTYLNVKGAGALLSSVKRCFASLFNARAISYRTSHSHMLRDEDIKIAVAVQKMVRSDVGSAGVAFSIDPETGYDKAIIINSAFGLGELVVSGGVKPDEFILDKRVLKNIEYDPIVMKKKGDKCTKIVYSSVSGSAAGHGHCGDCVDDGDCDCDCDCDCCDGGYYGCDCCDCGSDCGCNCECNCHANNISTTPEHEFGFTKEVPTTDFERKNYSLTNDQAIVLGRYVLRLEMAYSKLAPSASISGIDVEWAVDGIDNHIYIIQARPETVHSNHAAASSAGSGSMYNVSKYILDGKCITPLITGVSVGEKISSGMVRIIHNIKDVIHEDEGSSNAFCPGDILVTDMTTPDWEPIMKKSAGIITNRGGRTCHAAIVARELGLNAIVGTSCATRILTGGMDVTMNCADGEQGAVYAGRVPFHIDTAEFSYDAVSSPSVKLMLNLGNPENSFNASVLPNSGVGLTRMEFIISNYIKIHPLALYHYPNLECNDTRNKIAEMIGDRDSGKWFFIKRLARGLAKIASAFYPNDVIVRFSDFKSNEYKSLIGGEAYEPVEENPMIGWRGASRYYSPDYEKGFELECEAIKYARNDMGMTNIVVMIPFCRTPEECTRVQQVMQTYGLKRGENGLRVFLMCEIPSNVIEANEFSPMVDGVSIGGNDLLQLTLGIDRDSDRVTYLSNSDNLSYRRMIEMAIKTYRSNGVKVGFCGQQPSDSIEFCKFLIGCGIDSISVTPDAVLKTIKNL